jgi:hypothetical protein
MRLPGGNSPDGRPGDAADINVERPAVAVGAGAAGGAVRGRRENISMGTG